MIDMKNNLPGRDLSSQVAVEGTAIVEKFRRLPAAWILYGHTISYLGHILATRAS
jgi:hypothetical protein